LATFTSYIRLSTDGDGDVCPLTDRVAAIVGEAGVERGVAVVFAPGATVAVTTMEFEPGGVADLKTTLDRLIPPDASYEHNRLNHDTNSHAHIRAAIVGPSRRYRSRRAACCSAPGSRSSSSTSTTGPASGPCWSASSPEERRDREKEGRGGEAQTQAMSPAPAGRPVLTHARCVLW
jgi:thiamine phosphate synthase YjbQ (UPF0047 family)